MSAPLITLQPGNRYRLDLDTPSETTDFDWFEVDIEARRICAPITDAGPFQGWLWRGKRIRIDSIKVGSRPVFERGLTLNYPITKITPIEAGRA